VTAPTAAEVTDRVSVCEAWARDGIQGWPTTLETADKLRVVTAAAASGVGEIDAASFVPASVVPQFADAADVLAGIDESVRIRVLTVNVRGAARVVDAHTGIRRIDRCGIPFSASEPHNLANLRRDHAAHKEQVAAMVDTLGAAGIDPLIGIATAWGCPIQGRVEPDAVFGLVDWAHGLGVRSIMFGDTTGMADPRGVTRLFRAALDQWPDVDFVAHFHDNRGVGIANTLAAIAAGVRTVDASLGGVGGEPSAVDQGDVGESGNVVSEDLVAALRQMDVPTGIDLDALLRAGRLAEDVLGRPLHSRVQRSGPVDRTEFH
jgi:hydroxymethylglutaryl-CoA lyase